MPTLTPSYDTAVFNAQIPKEGPKTLPITADWSVASSYDLNLLLTQAQLYMSLVQGVYVDNSNNDAQVALTISVINQIVKIPALAQGYFPLFVPKNAIVSVTDTSGVSTDQTVFMFYNIPMPAVVWYP